jgi:thiol-disulfide isomerase/thioredoxin
MLWRKRNSAVVCSLLAILLIASASAPGKPSPSDLALNDLEGKRVRLRDYRGRIVVLNFWATWCVPCQEEMPMLVEAESVWGPKGVVFLGASLDEKSTRKNIPGFLKKFQVAFPVWLGATAADLDKLGMGDAVPDTAFLDQEGIIFARVQGETTRAEIDERLAWITSNRTGPAPSALVRHL